MKRLILSATLCLPLLAFGSQENTGSDNGERPHITEWQVPWKNTRPRDPDLGPDGDVWFVGQTGDYIARLDPSTGEFKRFPLDEGTGPHNLIVGEEGSIWYAGNLAAHIGQMDPQTGRIEKIPMPDRRARDPHTLVFDGSGDIWFTAQGGNVVGKLTVAEQDVSIIDVPTKQARPYGIKVDGDTIWAALFGTNKLAKIDADTMALREIELPRQEARPRRIGITDNGNVWYVDYVQGRLGRFDPDQEIFREWNLPSGDNSRPYGMAVDAQNRIWMVETGVEPNRLVGFDPHTEEFFSSAPIESGGGTVRHMVYDPGSHAIWFGTDANTIGRARLPE